MSADETRTELGVYMDAYRDGQMGWGEFTIQADRLLRAWLGDSERLAAAEVARDTREREDQIAKRTALETTLQSGNLGERVIAAIKLGVPRVALLTRDRVPEGSRDVEWMVPRQMPSFVDVEAAQLPQAALPHATMVARIQYDEQRACRFVDVTTLSGWPKVQSR